MYIIFAHNSIAHLLYYSINIANTTFYMHWKPENSCDSLYCNSHLIVVVWYCPCNISELCLNMERSFESERIFEWSASFFSN